MSQAISYCGLLRCEMPEDGYCNYRKEYIRREETTYNENSI